MSKQILVFGDKNFKITVPDEACITFGPWSPPGDRTRTYGEAAMAGTLRVYSGKTAKPEHILAVFSGVRGFRDLSLDYMEEVAKEEGATIWKSDQNGYEREEKRKATREWVTPQLPGSVDDGLHHLT